ncbi:MAG TPA: mannosyltransferase family protein [Capillimicrobium sp.]|nr:mannosyltransferase family protein [Capillimicrobium sp.]
MGADRPRSALALGEAWTALWTSRLLVWVAGVGAVWVWGLSDRAPGFDPAGVTGGPLFAPAARWDAVWYLVIARHGYVDDPSAAFFPLYPLLLRGLGGSVAAGILLSCACLLVALAVLRELTALELGDEAARWTVLMLAFSPMAFFLSAVYSESLFLALTAGAVLAVRRERWAWAGVLGMLAAATRSTGVLILVALVMLAFAGRARPRARDLAWLALVPAGLAAFPVGLALAGLDWRAPFDAQDVWFREWAGPLGGVWDGLVAAWAGVRQLVAGAGGRIYFPQAAGDPMAIARINVVLALWLPLVGIALAGVLRRLPLAFGAYVVASLAVPLSYPVVPQPLMSLPRFVLVCFPLWMWLGWLLARHRRARAPALAASAILLAVSTAQFATWHFVA